MALETDFMFYRPNMQYRPSFNFPVPAHLRAAQAANGSQMPQPGVSGQCKSISNSEVSSCSFTSLIILPLLQSSQSSSYYSFK
jgi:hypothetical protein